jgi:hypothetical protein
VELAATDGCCDGGSDGGQMIRPSIRQALCDESLN